MACFTAALAGPRSTNLGKPFWLADADRLTVRRRFGRCTGRLSTAALSSLFTSMSLPS